jgi:hypothetical protein
LGNPSLGVSLQKLISAIFSQMSNILVTNKVFSLEIFYNAFALTNEIFFFVVVVVMEFCHVFNHIFYRDH